MRTFTLTGWSGVGFPESIDWNTGVPDADGCYWIAEDLMGWDGPDIASNFQNRAGVPGQWLQSGEAIGRTLSVRNALLIAPDEVTRMSARDRLQRILLSTVVAGNVGKLLVHDVTTNPLVTFDRYIEFNATQKPLMEDLPPADGAIGGVGMLGHIWASRLTWVIVSEDPYRYADVEEAAVIVDAATHEAVNFGDSPTPVRFHLNLPGSHVEINHSYSGRTIVLDGAMPSQVHVDTGARTVVDGAGVNRYDLVISTPDQWFNLLPGLGFNLLTVTGVTGAPGGSINWHPAWS